MYFCKSSETSKVFLVSSPMAQNNVSSYVSSEAYQHETLMNGMGVEVDWQNAYGECGKADLLKHIHMKMCSKNLFETKQF